MIGDNKIFRVIDYNLKFYLFYLVHHNAYVQYPNTPSQIGCFDDIQRLSTKNVQPQKRDWLYPTQFFTVIDCNTPTRRTTYTLTTAMSSAQASPKLWFFFFCTTTRHYSLTNLIDCLVRDYISFYAHKRIETRLITLYLSKIKLVEDFQCRRGCHSSKLFSIFEYNIALCTKDPTMLSLNHSKC